MAWMKPGVKVGKITITNLNDNSNYSRGNSIACICDCGNKCIKTRASLYTAKHRKSETLSCGCEMYQYSRGNSSYKWKGYKQISSRLWHRYKTNARTRHIPFNITTKEAWSVLVKQEYKCILTQQTLQFGQHTYDYDNQTASLDRIDPNKPYVIDNVQWIHKTINNMKWDLTNGKFIYYCNCITKPLVFNDPAPSTIIIPRNKNYKGIGNISGDHWYRIRTRATKKSINLDISLTDIWTLFLEQNGYCALTGIPLTLEGTKFSASLDRIDNSKGYTDYNIQWIHKDINRKLKKNLSESELKWWAKLVSTTALEKSNESGESSKSA